MSNKDIHKVVFIAIVLRRKNLTITRGFQTIFTQICTMQYLYRYLLIIIESLKKTLLILEKSIAD